MSDAEPSLDETPADADAQADAEATPDPAQRITILGEASPEQIAALLAVISGLGGEPEAPPTAASRWAARERSVRATVTPGPGAWRASGLPR